jgi:hypothetical protein
MKAFQCAHSWISGVKPFVELREGPLVASVRKGTADGGKVDSLSKAFGCVLKSDIVNTHARMLAYFFYCVYRKD